MRIREYRRWSLEYRTYRAVLRGAEGITPPFESIEGNTTAILHRFWKAGLHAISPAILRKLDHRATDIDQLERVLEEVPDRTSGKAFIGRNIERVLLEERLRIPEPVLTEEVNALFFKHIADATGGAFVVDLNYIRGGLPVSGPAAFSYRQAVNDLSAQDHSSIAQLVGASPLEIWHLRQNTYR
jgi:hypothetical protein